MILDHVALPIVLAPLGGGPSTPRLAAAVADAGGFPFLAAGYLTCDALADQIATTRGLTDRPFGVNVFVPQEAASCDIGAYAQLLAPEAQRLGVRLGEPRNDDDGWSDKLALLAANPPSVVSFTFGCPSPTVMRAMQEAGTEIWITVTTSEEAEAAESAGADALIAQGVEAGGHRGTWDDAHSSDGLGVLALLQVMSSCRIPVIAAGGVGTGRAIAAVLAAGARAAALGTAFLRCPEAGTSDVHRQALTGTVPTTLTRAFTGRTARGIRNRFLDEYGDQAPSAYPQVHYLTAPLRHAARQQGKSDVVNLWAGQAYRLARDLPAGEIVRRLAAELTAASQSDRLSFSSGSDAGTPADVTGLRTEDH